MNSKGNDQSGSLRTYQPVPNLVFDVVPINPIDTTNLVKPFIITYSLYFTGHLDPDKLHNSLELLILRKYRILGARLVSAIIF